MGGRAWLGVIAACCALGAACGGAATRDGDDTGGSSGSGGSGALVPCAPGETVSCRGDLGCTGTRTCLADGSSFGECLCGGAGGAGNAGGSAGSFATGGVGGSIVIDGGGATGGFAGGVCASISYEAEPGPRAVQIVLALDNSSTMAEEVPIVEDNLNAFVDTLATAGIETRVVLVTSGDVCVPRMLGSGACPNDANPPAYLHVVAPISGGDALDRLIQFYPQYSSVLRTDWLTYAGVISDANSSMSASQFSSAFVALNPAFSNWKFAGVVCGGTCEPACSATASVYQTLATQTGGFAGDFCSLQSAMAGVAASIVEAWTPPCSWDLPEPLAGETLDPRYVNLVYTLPGSAPVLVPYVETAAACGTAPGWYYDDAISPTRMSVCPATCSIIQATPEATIEIQLGCLTTTRP